MGWEGAVLVPEVRPSSPYQVRLLAHYFVDGSQYSLLFGLIGYF